jgi:PST family polysaccharide transporter
VLKIFIAISTIQTLAILASLARSKVVAVFLGPEGVGIISIVDQVVQVVAQISALSLPVAAVKFLSRSHSEGIAAFRRSYSSFLKALLMMSIAGTVVTITLATFHTDLFGSEISRYRDLLIIALIGIPTMILGSFFSSVLAAAQKPRTSATLAVITNAISSIATYIGISLGAIYVGTFMGKLLALYFGNVLAAIFLTAGILIYLRKTLHLPLYDRNVGLLDELKRSPEIIIFSFVLFFAATTYSLSLLVARYAVLMNFGEAEAGLFQAVLALALGISMVLNSANGLFFMPVVNRNISTDEKIRTAIEFQNRLIIIQSVVAMPVALFPQLMLTLLFSPQFTVASQYVFLFVIAQCILQLAGVYQVLLIGLDDLVIYATVTCAGHLSLALFSWILTPHYGIFGISISFVISGAITFLMAWARLRSKHGFSIPGRLGSLIGYSLSALLLVGMISSKYEDWNVSVALLKAGVYLSFMVSMLFFLSKEERSALLGLRHKLKLKPM